MALEISLCAMCGDMFEADGGRFCCDCGPLEAERLRNKHSQKDRKRMLAVAAMAKADPSVVCWLCGRREPPNGYNGIWTGDHVDPGTIHTQVLPAHKGCNSARGERSVEWFRQHIAKGMRRRA